MSKTLYLSFCILLNYLCVCGQTYTSVIQTTSGPIRGIISTTIENIGYAAFKGIPYAKPPVGNLRFKPPVETDSRMDVHNATTEGSVCTQFHPLVFDSVQGSEDCLYINVYTPHTIFNESISKPVMAWIHGGGYTLGFANESVFGPDFLLKEDVILVAFNYRLGALGFLNLEHENATGNFGLKDQNLALKWVKKNIAQFGGNPNNVTIFGESAGAASVDLHVLSDMSVGLFSQSISMSGSPLCIPWGFQSGTEAVKHGFLLGSKLGTNTSSKDDLLKTLYNASAADIVIAASAIDLFPFRPTLENSNIAVQEEKFLTTCSLTKYLNGNYSKGPHMMGHTAKETASMIDFLGGFFTMAQKTLEALQNSTSTKPFLAADLTNEITGGKPVLSGNVTDQFIEESSSLFFNYGIDTKQRYISQNNGHSIYYYRFSFVPPNNPLGREVEGAGHGDLLPYIFYTPLLQLPSNQTDIAAAMQKFVKLYYAPSASSQLPLNQEDIATTRQRMVKLWTNFAKYGNPTPFGDNDTVLGIVWPDSRPDGACLNIGKNLTIIPRPSNNLDRILQLVGIINSPVLSDCDNN